MIKIDAFPELNYDTCLKEALFGNFYVTIHWPECRSNIWQLLKQKGKQAVLACANLAEMQSLRAHTYSLLLSLHRVCPPGHEVKKKGNLSGS